MHIEEAIHELALLKRGYKSYAPIFKALQVAIDELETLNDGTEKIIISFDENDMQISTVTHVETEPEKLIEILTYAFLQISDIADSDKTLALLEQIGKNYLKQKGFN